VSLDDDIHVIETVKGFLFAKVLLHENPTSSQSNANGHSDKKRSTEQDQIHACHCMGLPNASLNTQF
jgi:hypothetical protein